MTYRGLRACLAGIALLTSIQSASAQGLLWNLPAEDGTVVYYEGKYKQTDARPDSSAGALTVEWDRKLWIKSVGTEMAEFRGEMQACRWIEFKLITGVPNAEFPLGTDPGLVGARIYKVLIPESVITGKAVDDQTIPVSLVPIIKGYRRFGEGEVKPIKSNVLQVYPLVSMIMHFEDMKKDDIESDPGVPLGPLAATHYTAKLEVESRMTRTTNDTQLWTSKDVPFGLAKWEIKVVREAKDISDPRTDYAVTSTVDVNMSVQRVDKEAESELVIPE